MRRAAPSAALAGLVLALLPGQALAGDVSWDSEVVFYGDNTEFFTPYRVGDTLLGAYFSTYLDVRLGPRTSLRAGLFGDHRDGSDDFLDPVRPVLSFRFQTPTSLGVIGTLETGDRHGHLEPLQSRELELTRPVEYGLQWVETRGSFRGEAYLDWQRLSSEESREVFDYGVVVRGDLAEWACLEGQLHGVHRGGQRHQVGPVATNLVRAAGGRVRWAFSPSLRAELAGFYLASSGPRDMLVEGESVDGHGTYLRGGVLLGRAGEVFGIWWQGEDFISAEGDPNYGSVGREGGFYRSERSYQELGWAGRWEVERGVTFSAEARLHRIDGDVDYSYRLLVRVPLSVHVGSL